MKDNSALNTQECNEIIGKLDDLRKILLNVQSSGLTEIPQEIKAMKESENFKQLISIFESVSFVINSLTDDMVTHNAGMANNLYSLAFEASDSSMVDSLRGLKSLQQSGALKVLIELSDVISFAYNALTDDMIQRIVATLSSFTEILMTQQTQEMFKSMTECVSDTVENFTKTPPKTGLRSMISLMRDPEIQKGVTLMAHLTRNFQQCLTKSHQEAE
ncbi:MAG: DUF1641 domain-containing protein [Nitrospirae bacterium]|nr:DUF1641 domain-containing protein [Nitrospirota bacterium]MBF0535555.1 DUF1641 domain-containing protein [Nitrospirota bacterium]MBF0617418.1 DUF1641 domain-containing protein [Nitrospirota bacterium]